MSETIECADCGKAVEKRSWNQKRCRECSHAHRLEGMRRWRAEHPERCMANRKRSLLRKMERGRA